MFKEYAVKLVALTTIVITLGGCWLVAAGAGAEGGYIAAQEDRSPGETVNDQRITSVVKSRLLRHPEVSGLDINVDTHKGVVSLKGVVESPSEAKRAVELASTVAGVTTVENRMVVRPG